MSKTLVWAVNAASESGGVSSGGSVNVTSVTSASVTVDVNASVDLDLQLADVGKLSFIAISASRYDGEVSVTPSGAATPLVLDGPLVLFGKAIALLGGTLATLKVTNGATAKARVDVLLGGELSPP